MKLIESIFKKFIAVSDTLEAKDLAEEIYLVVSSNLATKSMPIEKLYATYINEINKDPMVSHAFIVSIIAASEVIKMQELENKKTTH